MTKVIGIGGAGRKALAGLKGEDFSVIGIDTDNSDEELLPENYFFGTRGSGGLREWAVELVSSEIVRLKPIFESNSRIIFVASLGGGTGSGVTPILTRIAKESNLDFHVVAILPFFFEGSYKNKAAETSLSELREITSNISIYDNTKLISEFSKMTEMNDYFSSVNAKIQKEILKLTKWYNDLEFLGSNLKKRI